MKAVKQFCIASCMTVALAGSAMAGGMCEGYKMQHIINVNQYGF